MYTVVDLFSGAGGLSRGFLDAGYDVVLGVDHDKAALKTFEENHAGATAMNLDLFDHNNIDKIVSLLNDFEGYPRRLIISTVEFRDIKVFDNGDIIRF